MREAIVSANDAEGADLIQFDLPAGTDEILLTEGEIDIIDSLQIDGPGAEELTINAGGSVANFRRGGSRSLFVQWGLQGLTLTGGSADDGGAIHNLNASLTISDSVLTDNSATLGGAIHTENDFGGIFPQSLYLDGTVISGNSAVDGGGIYNFNDHVELNNGSLITGNDATGNGGGVYTSADFDDGLRWLWWSHRDSVRR